ncbi:hypothetical protein [Cellulomonas sp. P5_C5]
MALPVRVEVNFHHFRIAAGTFEEEPMQTPAVSLIFEPLRTRASVLSGIASGPVLVECQALLEPPAQVPDEWEDVAEVSLVVGPFPLVVLGWADDPEPDRLDAAGPGTYRVRAHAIGRDTLWDVAVDEPVERFLVQAWPAPHEPPRTLRATSERAKSETRGA